jgi:hypothetical protein
MKFSDLSSLIALGVIPLRKVVRRAFYLTALIIIANGVGPFDMWNSPLCWAGQTINVKTGDNLQTLVTQYPPSTTFSLAPGIHRLQSVVPQTGDSFVGQTGAVLSGAALLTSFTPSGSYWTAHVQVTKAATYPGECNPAFPACTYPEDLFFNNVPKTRVTNVSAVGPGKWYLDYSTGTVYMGDNPAGYTVEISLLRYAFTGGAHSVTISNMTIEQYACVAQSGAINGAVGSLWWTIQGNEIRYNHGRGITSGNGMFISNNRVHHNGQLGMGGGGTNFTVQNNEISYNNYSGYSYYWEAGGLKFAGAHDVMIQYNYSHNNVGPGFWNDIASHFITYNANQASANVVAGIMTEISYNITISNNYIWNDGYNPDGSGIWWGAGILVSNSSNVSIYSNVVSNCMDGIGGILANRGNGPDGQPYLLQNMTVTSNTVTQGAGKAAGIVLEGTGLDNSVYTSSNNTFQNNTYNLSNRGGSYFYWLAGPVALNAWAAAVGGE